MTARIQSVGWVRTPERNNPGGKGGAAEIYSPHQRIPNRLTRFTLSKGILQISGQRYPFAGSSCWWVRRPVLFPTCHQHLAIPSECIQRYCTRVLVSQRSAEWRSLYPPSYLLSENVVRATPHLLTTRTIPRKPALPTRFRTTQNPVLARNLERTLLRSLRETQG